MLREGRAAPYVGSTTESSIITAPMTSANQATAQATFLPFSSGGGAWEDGPSLAAPPPSPPAPGPPPRPPFWPSAGGGGVWEDGPSIAASPPSRPASGRGTSFQREPC